MACLQKKAVVALSGFGQASCGESMFSAEHEASDV